MRQFPDSLTAIINAPLQSKMFVYGPAGCGKTTAGVGRLLHLLDNHVAGSEILIMIPQRTMGLAYAEALHNAEQYTGSSVSILTIGGLAQRMVALFWPLIAEEAGFSRPELPPTFLTLETAQYYMARIIEPLLEEGYFRSVVIDRNRLYSQIIDNLNKAAVVGFSYSEIGARLAGAWMGKPEQLHIYEDAQQSASQFRQFCLNNNLLDFSLQLEIFTNHLWQHPLCRDHLRHMYHHLIFDNIEEDTPVTHDLLQEWIPEFESVLVIYDEDAGYRRFLGADPEHAWLVSEQLPEKFHLTQSLVMSEKIQRLQQALGERLAPRGMSNSRFPEHKSAQSEKDAPVPAITFGAHIFFPELLDWTTGQINSLITRGVPPIEIAVLAPFVSDSLRFSVSQRLERMNIKSRTHRPSRALRDEPVTHCLFTLSKLAHPHWFKEMDLEALPNRFDIAHALVQTIDGLDLVRAQLLSEIVYRKRDGMVILGSFDQIRPEMQERITYSIGERFEYLRGWLENYQQSDPIEFDHFLSRLFGEVLSQPGFGFHHQYSYGEITANLIESIQKFRWVAAENLIPNAAALGIEYLNMVQAGVIAASYIRSWQAQPEDAILIAPAYTFLMMNHPVEYQFWLDIGSRSWSERLYQPLTHPFVLSRQWQEGQKWGDADEVSTSQEALFRLVTGLLRRCRSELFLGLSKVNEQGYEQRGPLLSAFQSILRTYRAGE